MEITKELIKERFDILNRQCFEGKIKTPHKILVSHSVSCAGYVRQDSRTKKIVLGISDFFDFNEASLDETIAHEMIHLQQIEEYGWKRCRHNRHFKRIMKDLNKKYSLAIGVFANDIPLTEKGRKKLERGYPKNKILNRFCKAFDKAFSFWYCFIMG